VQWPRDICPTNRFIFQKVVAVSRPLEKLQSACDLGTGRASYTHTATPLSGCPSGRSPRRFTTAQLLWGGAGLCSFWGMRTREAACSLALLTLSLACGGATPPAEGPTSPPPAAEDAAALADDPQASPKDASDSASEKPSGGPATEEDINAILQLVVDDPELDSHLNLGTPGRFPLQIAGERLPANLKLVKSSEPVKVVEAPKSKKDAVLVFTEIDVQGSKATVRYRYDVEGIRATVTLAKSPHGWELKNSRLVEH
jgi:hypothetical protein